MLAKILSTLYGYGVAYRNKQFDNGSKALVHTTAPVISVGNISVGGTGKTPTVQMLVRLLKHQGRRPAIVMRGYKRKSRGIVVVHDGQQMQASVKDAGDEAALHAHVLDVPVVVGEYKADAAVYCAGNIDCDVIVVDDGFQHRTLYRDIDVVLIDRQTIDKGWLLPRGRLREPLSSITRADVVLLHADVARDEVAEYCSPNTIVAGVQLDTQCPDLAGEKVFCLSAIANPERFIATAEKCGASVGDSKSFADHYWYSQADIARILEKAALGGMTVVTTEKDAVKLNEFMPMFAKANVPLKTIAVTMQLTDSTSMVHDLLNTLFTNNHTL